MEEEVDSTGQEEHSSDDPALPGPKVKEETQLQHIQEPSTLDQDLPIMHWEDLSLRIAELEKQEEERRKRAESKGSAEQESERRMLSHIKQHSPLRKQWEDDKDFGGCRFPFITSRRFNSPKNLQLCFVNNSDSDEEDDEGTSSKKSLCDTEGRGRCCAGLKQEVRAALSELRDKLWAEQKQQQQPPSSSDMSIRRKILSHSDLQTCSILQLNALSASLNEDIQDLSSELVRHLVVRDHLRTKQDAMLLDIEDMTCL